MGKNVSDSILAEQIRKEDKVAFRQLYNRYHKQLYFFAKRFLKEETLVEDAVQDIFIKLWDERDSLKGNTIKTFLFTMLKNHVLNLIRDRKTRRQILDSYRKITATKRRNPTEEDLIFEEYKEIVERAMDNLSPARRKVFEMKNFEGMSNSKIAEVRDVSVNTVKTQFYLSSKFIRKYLRKHAGF